MLMGSWVWGILSERLQLRTVTMTSGKFALTDLANSLLFSSLLELQNAHFVISELEGHSLLQEDYTP